MKNEKWGVNSKGAPRGVGMVKSIADYAASRLYGSYHFLPGGGGRLFAGDQNFWGSQRGGPFFFSGTNIFLRIQRGEQIFFTYAKGGPETIGGRPSQTDGPPSW